MSSPEAIVKQLARIKSNTICPNCGAHKKFGFSTVCIKFYTFVCNECKSSHQAISHRCKSLTMSSWTMEEVLALQAKGNDYARKTWLQNAPKEGTGGRPAPGSDINVYKRFVVEAYEHRRYYGELQSTPQQQALERPKPPPAPSVTKAKILAPKAPQSDPRKAVPTADLLDFSTSAVPTTQPAPTNAFSADFSKFETVALPNSKSIPASNTSKNIFSADFGSDPASQAQSSSTDGVFQADFGDFQTASSSPSVPFNQVSAFGFLNDSATTSATDKSEQSKSVDPFSSLGSVSANKGTGTTKQTMSNLQSVGSSSTSKKIMGSSNASNSSAISMMGGSQTSMMVPPPLMATNNTNNMGMMPMNMMPPSSMNMNMMGAGQPNMNATMMQQPMASSGMGMYAPMNATAAQQMNMMTNMMQQMNVMNPSMPMNMMGGGQMPMNMMMNNGMMQQQFMTNVPQYYQKGNSNGGTKK